MQSRERSGPNGPLLDSRLPSLIRQASRTLATRLQMAARHRRPLSAATIGLLMLVGAAGPASAGAPAWGPVRLRRLPRPRRARASREQRRARPSTCTAWPRRAMKGTRTSRTARGTAGPPRTVRPGQRSQRLNPISHLVGSASLATAGRYVFTTWVRPSRDRERPDAVRPSQHEPRQPGRVVGPAPTHFDDGPDRRAEHRRLGRPRVRGLHEREDRHDPAAISHDRGRTWTARSMGTTSVTVPVGGCSWCSPNTRRRTGHPIVVANGRDVAVFWVSDDGGSLQGAPLDRRRRPLGFG